MLPPLGRCKAHQQLGHRGLAAAGFAHKAERLAACDGKIHPVNGMDKLPGAAVQDAVDQRARQVKGLFQAGTCTKRRSCGKLLGQMAGDLRPRPARVGAFGDAAVDPVRAARGKGAAGGAGAGRGMAPSICGSTSGRGPMRGIEAISPAV
jgi:hypothetical protein